MGGAMTGTLERVKPLVSTTITTPEGVSFTAACFEGTNWSLAPLQRAGDEQKACELAARIDGALSGLGARFAYAPSPTQFNGKIIRPDTLTEEIRLGHVLLYRNPSAPADGTWLRRQASAGLFSAAGCSMIAVTLGQELIFAHAGRDCIKDRIRIKSRGQQEGRHYDSVVDSIVAALAPSSFLKKRLRVWVFYSIRPEDFLHWYLVKNPEHWEYNNAAAEMLPREYGHECGWVDARGISIDIPRIIRAQFIEHGVPVENINLEHAYLAEELPHTRNGDNKRRYLGTIVRNS